MRGLSNLSRDGGGRLTLRISAAAILVLLSATAAHAQALPHAELDMVAPNKLRLGWFVYEGAPAKCQHPATEVAKYLTEQLKERLRDRRSPSIEIEAKEIAAYAVKEVDAFDLVYFTPYTYVLAEKDGDKGDHFGDMHDPAFLPLVSYVFHGARERFSTIVWKETEGATLEDLLETLHNERRKRLALVNPRSTSGFLWPSRLLGKGIDIPRGKITTVFAGNHDSALEYFTSYKEVVAAATFDSHLEEYIDRHPGFPKHRSAALKPPLPLDAIAARTKTVPPEVRDAIRDAMLAMKKGEGVFDRCFAKKLDAWIAIEDSYYDLVRSFMNITRPTPPLHLEPSCDPMHSRIIRELADWFAILDSSSSPVADGARTLNFSCAGREKTLSTELAKLRTQHPITGYVIEDGAPASDPGVQDIRASFGNRKGLARGMAATIKRQIWMADVGQQRLSDIDARITQVLDNGEVHLRAVSEVARRSVTQDLDPGDREMAMVEVGGYSADVGGAEDRAELELDVKDADLTPEGGMNVEYRVRVRDRETRQPLPAKQWGWLLETTRDGVPGKPVLDLIAANEHDLTARIVLSGSSLSTRVTVRLLGSASSSASPISSFFDCRSSDPLCASRRFSLWSGISVWTLVLLGGLLGTMLRWAGLATASGPTRARPARWWIEFLARHGIELAAGLGTALLLFLVFVAAKPDVLKALDSNAIITRFGVGLVGGVVGASGLGALVQRMIGLKA